MLEINMYVELQFVDLMLCLLFFPFQLRAKKKIKNWVLEYRFCGSFGSNKKIRPYKFLPLHDAAFVSSQNFVVFSVDGIQHAIAGINGGTQVWVVLYGSLKL